MNSIKKILICYNEPVKAYKNYIGKSFSHSSENIAHSETELATQINEIIKALSVYFSNIETLVFNSDIKNITRAIENFAPDVIFNFVESVGGISNYEAYAAGLFEITGFDYTGNTPLCLSTCLNKSRTKQILKSFGINTPDFRIAYLNEGIDQSGFDLKFPVILKLTNEDASIGISEYSVVSSFDEMHSQLEFLFKTYKQDIIIEEFINGRELNVAVLGKKVLPISEIIFSGLPKGLPRIVTYEGKWSPESIYYKFTKPQCPAELDEVLTKKIESIAMTTFSILNCRDYARIDFRLSRNGTPYVIEVNPNPDLAQDAGFARAAAVAGISYPELLYTIAGFIRQRKTK